MAITYTTAVKTARMQAVADQIDAGTSGKLKIRDNTNTILAIVPLADPCGTVTGDTLTFDCDPDLTVAAISTGTAHNAIITDSSDVTVVSGLSVGLSAADVILDNLSINSGQNVVITLGSITHS